MKIKGWKKKYHTNPNDKKTGVSMLIRDEVDFKIRNIHRRKRDIL